MEQSAACAQMHHNNLAVALQAPAAACSNDASREWGFLTQQAGFLTAATATVSRALTVCLCLQMSHASQVLSMGRQAGAAQGDAQLAKDSDSDADATQQAPLPDGFRHPDAAADTSQAAHATLGTWEAAESDWADLERLAEQQQLRGAQRAHTPRQRIRSRAAAGRPRGQTRAPCTLKQRSVSRLKSVTQPDGVSPPQGRVPVPAQWPTTAAAAPGATAAPARSSPADAATGDSARRSLLGLLSPLAEAAHPAGPATVPSSRGHSSRQPKRRPAGGKRSQQQMEGGMSPAAALSALLGTGAQPAQAPRTADQEAAAAAARDSTARPEQARKASAEDGCRCLASPCALCCCLCIPLLATGTAAQ